MLSASRNLMSHWFKSCGLAVRMAPEGQSVGQAAQFCLVTVSLAARCSTVRQGELAQVPRPSLSWTALRYDVLSVRIRANRLCPPSRYAT